jgi:hypothetical protein
VHEPLLLVTDRDGSVSRDTDRVLHDGLLINRRLQKLLSSGSLINDLLTRRQADSNLYWNLYWSAAWISANSRRRTRAAREALRSLWLAPFSRPKAKLGLLWKIVAGKTV